MDAALPYPGGVEPFDPQSSGAGAYNNNDECSIQSHWFLPWSFASGIPTVVSMDEKTENTDWPSSDSGEATEHSARRQDDWNIDTFRKNVGGIEHWQSYKKQYAQSRQCQCYFYDAVGEYMAGSHAKRVGLVMLQEAAVWKIPYDVQTWWLYLDALEEINLNNTVEVTDGSTTAAGAAATTIDDVWLLVGKQAVQHLPQSYKLFIATLSKPSSRGSNQYCKSHSIVPPE